MLRACNAVGRESFRCRADSGGRSRYCLDEREAALIAEQVKRYDAHGIDVRRGDTIFGVKANVGPVTLSSPQRAGDKLTVSAFEPFTTTRAVPAANCERVDPARLHAPNCGVGVGEGTLIFACYPPPRTTTTAQAPCVRIVVASNEAIKDERKIQ